MSKFIEQLHKLFFFFYNSNRMYSHTLVKSYISFTIWDEFNLIELFGTRTRISSGSFSGSLVVSIVLAASFPFIISPYPQNKGDAIGDSCRIVVTCLEFCIFFLRIAEFCPEMAASIIFSLTIWAIILRDMLLFLRFFIFL